MVFKDVHLCLETPEINSRGLQIQVWKDQPQFGRSKLQGTTKNVQRRLPQTNMSQLTNTMTFVTMCQGLLLIHGNMKISEAWIPGDSLTKG